MKQAISLKKRIFPLSVMVFALAIAAACSSKSVSAPPEQGVAAQSMCQEHGVPEALCTRCNRALEASFKAAGDWCGKHKLPESQCTRCNPDALKKFAPAADKPAGSEAGHGADDGHGHGAAEAVHEDEVTLTAEAVAQNKIKVEAARKHSLGEVFTAPARVSYNTEAMAHVGTPVNGRVAEMKARLGDVVKKGDELLVIDSPALGEAQSDFLQKKMQAQVAESALEVAQTSAERARRLHDGKGISLGEYQKRDGEFKAARGALKAAQAALTAAENSLHLWGITQVEINKLLKTGEINPRYSVRAPMPGTVIQREATLGEIVGPERDALLVLADMRTLWVLADVPENTIHSIAAGAPALVQVESLKGQTFRGSVAYIAPELDKATRTGQVRVEVPDGHTPLKPGMFAQVSLTLGHRDAKTTTSMLAVPETAVQTFEGGPCVFVEVEGEPNTFAKCAVKVGPSVGRMVPILGGLDEGKRYVSAGAFIVKAELSKAIMEGKTCSGH